MKKFIKYLLCLVLCLGVVGCGNSSESKLDYDEMRREIKNKGFTIEALELSSDSMKDIFKIIEFNNGSYLENDVLKLTFFFNVENNKIDKVLFSVRSYYSKSSSTLETYSYYVKNYKFSENNDSEYHSTDMKVLEDFIDFIGYSEKDLLLFLEDYYANNYYEKDFYDWALLK